MIGPGQRPSANPPTVVVDHACPYFHRRSYLALYSHSGTGNPVSPAPLRDGAGFFRCCGFAAADASGFGVLLMGTSRCSLVSS